MTNSVYSRAQQRRAAGLCAAMVLVLLASLLFITHEANHDCSGRDCPICACIRQAENHVKQLGTGTAALPAALPVVLLLAALLCMRPCALPCENPVSQKVRLNN